MVAAYLGILLAWLGCAIAAPEQPKATLVPDTTELVVGQSVGLDLIVTGAQPAGTPELPTDRGLLVRFRGQAQSTSIVNGHVAQQAQLRYDLSAVEAGTWTLGPAAIRVLDGTGRTLNLPAEAVTIHVSQPTETKDDDQPLAVDAGFDTTSAWQGQVVVWHEAVHARVELASLRWMGTPSEGLLAPREGKPDQRRYANVDALGTRYSYETWTPWIATAVGTHDYGVPAVELEVVLPQSGPGGLLGFVRRTRREVRTAPPVELTVKPLPPPPPDFSGIVGDFKVLSSAEAKDARVGKSLPWTVVISGNGALDSLKLPADDIDGARVYDTSPNTGAVIRDGVYGSHARFDRNIVPLREGLVVVPDIDLVVFSPSQGAYTTLHVPGVTLDVKPGTAVQTELTSFGTQAPEATALVADDDIRPLRGSGPGTRLPWSSAGPWAWALLGGPGLWIGLSALWQRLLGAWRARRDRDAADRGPARQALRLDRLPADPQARLAALGSALQEALAAYAQEREVPHDQALAAMAEPLHGQVQAALTALNRARFGGDVAHDALGAQVAAAHAAILQELGR